LNGFISAVVGITKHRNANNAIVDEIYPNSVIDNQTTETYTVKNSSISVNYNITIVKSGNIAHIKGTISNVGGYYYTNQPIFTWKVSEVIPKPIDLYFYAENSTEKVRLRLNQDSLSIFNDVIGIASYNFDFKTYITQD